MLVEGSSMSSVSRILGIDYTTVLKLLEDAGEACIAFHDDAVQNVPARYVQVDEMVSFCYAKSRNVETATAIIDRAGNVWTWTAIDTDTKLIISWLAGGRDGESATRFMRDLHSRVADRIQLSSDGYGAYPLAVEAAFGGEVDYARFPHEYEPSAERRMLTVVGAPNLDEMGNTIIERQNLTMRMSLKRLARSTNAFSRKFANHCYALALYFVWYNFCREHNTIGKTPAQAAGLAQYPYDMRQIVELMNARVPAQVRGPYRKRVAA